MLAAPVTLKLARFVYAPSTSAAPVMVSALAPPFKVLWVLMLEPVSVVLAPKLTAPRYLCSPLVVTAFDNSAAPVTSRLDDPPPRTMLLPAAMLRLAMVCVLRRSQMDVPDKLTSVDAAKLPVSTSVPSSSVVAPV